MSNNYDVYARVQANMRKLFLGIVVAIVVVGVITTGIILWVTGDNDDAGDKPANQQTGSTVTPSGVPSNNPVDIPAQQLANITWQEVKTTGMWLPVSPQAGPKNRAHDLASGFAHTPLGAVLAATHIVGRATVEMGSDIFEPTVRQQMVGKDVELALAKMLRSYEQKRQANNANPGEPVGQVQAQEVGFRIEHFEEKYAAIHLLVKVFADDGRPPYADVRCEMQWIDGDWKLIVPIDADWESQISPATSLNQYTLFPSRK